MEILHSIDYAELMAMGQRRRAALINSAGGFKSLVLAGTRSASGHTNLAVFNSLFHIGANPPLAGLIFRPDSVERHTLQNILDTGFYTLNHVNEGFFRQAHQTSARYSASASEFAETGLEEEYIKGFSAPFVAQSRIKMAMEFRERHDLQINGTILIIGEIRTLYFPENCLFEDGTLDLEKAGTLTCSGLDSYHQTRRLARLTYAKPGISCSEIPAKYPKD